MIRVGRSLVRSSFVLIVCCQLSIIRIQAKESSGIPIFEKLQPNKNLSFGIVEDIQQDTSGFIWIGAKDGLFRYDGITFKSYQYNRNDTRSLSSNVIRELFVDSRGNLWIGTENGLNLYHPNDDKFQKFYSNPNSPQSLSGNNVRKIAEDKTGNLWIATFGGGVCRYDVNTFEFMRIEQIIKSDQIDPSLDNRTIYIDSEGTVWIGTANKGVLFFNPDDPNLYQLPLGIADGKHLNYQDVRAIVEDPDGIIWIGTNGKGLAAYDKKNKTFAYYNSVLKGPHHIDCDIIWNLYCDSEHNLWASTDGGGLLRLSAGANMFKEFTNSSTDPNSISSNVVRVFYEDNAGNYWVGNFNAPVNYVNTHRKKFGLLRDFDIDSQNKTQNKITSILRDSENNLWICTDGSGLYEFSPEREKYIKYEANPSVSGSIYNNKPLCCLEDVRGNLWIGLYEGGLSFLDKNKKKFINYLPDGTQNNPKSIQIWALALDENVLWIAGDQGIENYNLSTSQFNHNPFPFYSETIFSAWDVKIDSDKRIWIGTIKGLFLFDPETNTMSHFVSDAKDTTSLSDSWVLNIHEDKNHQIWVGTNGGGLNLWKGAGKFQCFTTQNGLSGNVINGILSDNSGNLWISTNSGLTKFNIDSLEFTNFTVEDGLQDNRFNINSYSIDKEGIMYFGGTNGLTYFNPEQIVKNKFIPPVLITELEIFNKSEKKKDSRSPSVKNILYQKVVHIYPEQLIFTIHFSALNFSRPERNQYKYKLEGFDNNWNAIGNRHWATYTNLRPGKYTFRVIASNDDNVWNYKGAKLQIIVHPPFYRTYWFIILMILLCVGAAMAFYLIRLKNIRTLNKKLSELVSERTRELELRNAEIALQNEEIICQRDMATSQRDQIIKQNEELEKHRNRLEELVKERTHDLVDAKERAENSDRLKSAFLDNLSHQIRTPMNAILGFINLLTEKIDDKMSREYYLRIINESGRSMLRLIEDIIDYSRFQTGQLQLEYDDCNVSNLIRQLISTGRERASRDNPSLSILADLPEKDIFMYTDEKKLQQIFFKLLENSIKYTEEGYIRLGIHQQEENYITFKVEDSGVCIDEKYLEKAFDSMYSTEDEENSGTHRDSGLGLPLTKVIVELLGGKIWIESRKDQGSAFYVKIPFITTPPEKKKSTPKESKKMYWPGKSILVAEDEDSNYLLIEAILKDTGVKLIHVSDGVELLEKINDGVPFDLVLLDLKMPRMGGINAVKIIRESNKDVPVIVQTAYDQTNHREQCQESGCNEFLVKPLRKIELLNVVSKYFA
jgi:signal transduction histidine kinase/ligand-binding sensor domain-containing protein/CheY-like chemotaxis protein